MVGDVVGMNRVFTAMPTDQAPSDRRHPLDDALDPAYRDSAQALLIAFNRPGVLERSYRSPLGEVTGAERLQIRRYDLLAHGWDLARATGLPAHLPDDAAERALAFVRIQLTDDARPGRFAPAQNVSAGAPAIDRLAGFLGHRPAWKPWRSASIALTSSAVSARPVSSTRPTRCG